MVTFNFFTMKNFVFLTFLAAALLIVSSCANSKFYREFAFSSVKNNVCKTLDDKVVIYAIFVDSKYTGVWNEYDLTSTSDSICKAINWIEKKAAEDSVDLKISLEIHKASNGRLPIKQEFKRKTLSATLYDQKYSDAERELNKWSDEIAAIAGKSLPRDKNQTTKTRNNLRDTERLIARLRDIHKTDNIALLYFVNNYFKDELSLALNTDHDKNVEYGVISFKNPAVIAHEFLHLFGAMDMYVSSLDKKIREKKIKLQMNKRFPNEVMTNSPKSLDDLMISDFTKYLIGWHKELSSDF